MFKYMNLWGTDHIQAITYAWHTCNHGLSPMSDTQLNPSNQGVKAGGSEVQGHSQMYTKFKVNQVYI